MTDTETATHVKPAANNPHNPIGASGLRVSALGLGTMTFGLETCQAAAFDQLDHYREHGGTFIDSADVYAAGEAERIVGRWLAERKPDNMIVATKGRFNPPAGSSGASRRSLVRSVDASLQRLRIDAIDLYFVHGWDNDTSIAETLGALTDLVAAGKIHHVGWSNITGWQLGEIAATARLSGYVQPCVVQPQYNLLDRGIETELLPASLANGLAITPWSPLGGGWLSGKYTVDQRPTGTTRLGEDPERGVEAYDLRNNARTWSIIETLTEIAANHNQPISRIAIAWLIRRPGVASVLLGARTVSQLAENMGASEIQLTQAELTQLTVVSAPGLPPYPYGLIEDFCHVDSWQQLGTRRS